MQMRILEQCCCRLRHLMRVAAVLACIPGVASAQTARSTLAVAPPAAAAKEARTAGATTRNPWVFGSQIGAQFYGNGGFTDDLLLAGKFVQPVVAGTPIELAAFGNLGKFTDSFDGLDEAKRDEAIANLLTGNRGAAVGLQATWLMASDRWWKLIPFAQGDLRITRAKTTDTTSTDDDGEKAATLLQRRAGFGVEVHLGKGDSTRPFTISWMRSRTWADSSEFAGVFGTQKMPTYVNEVTAIIPIATRFGAVVELVKAPSLPEVWRVGFLVVAGEKSPEEAEKPATRPEQVPETQPETPTPNVATRSIVITKPASGTGKVTISWTGDGKFCTFTAVRADPCVADNAPSAADITIVVEADDGSIIDKLPDALTCKPEGERKTTCTLAANASVGSFPAPFKVKS